MKDTKSCPIKSSCCWNHKHEIFGAIFILIATLLTIFTVNSLGILGMFVVGGMLLCCKHNRCNCGCECACHDHCHDHKMHECCEPKENQHSDEKTHKKPTTNAKAKK